MTQAAYLVAELATLVDELRNPRTVFSRDQLADLAERARHDAAALNQEPLAARPARRQAPIGGATIIPFPSAGRAP